MSDSRSHDDDDAYYLIYLTFLAFALHTCRHSVWRCKLLAVSSLPISLAFNCHFQFHLHSLFLIPPKSTIFSHIFHLSHSNFNLSSAFSFPLTLSFSLSFRNPLPFPSLSFSFLLQPSHSLFLSFPLTLSFSLSFRNPNIQPCSVVVFRPP